MRLLLRITGTWLLGLALILLIIDGTRSLAADALVMTPLFETWQQLHAQSLADVRGFFETRFFGQLLDVAFGAVLSLPGWIALGVPGVLLAWLGRTRRARVFLRQSQF